MIIDGLAELYRNVQDIKTTMRATAHVGDFVAWDAPVIHAIQQLRAEIAAIRANVTE